MHIQDLIQILVLVAHHLQRRTGLRHAQQPTGPTTPRWRGGIPLRSARRLRDLVDSFLLLDQVPLPDRVFRGLVPLRVRSETGQRDQTTGQPAGVDHAEVELPGRQVGGHPGRDVERAKLTPRRPPSQQQVEPGAAVTTVSGRMFYRDDSELVLRQFAERHRGKIFVPGIILFEFVDLEGVGQDIPVDVLPILPRRLEHERDAACQ